MRSISSPETPARSTAAFTAVAPRSVAETSASAPCMDPIGVRAIDRMTVGSSRVVAMGLLRSRICCGAHKTAGPLVQTLGHGPFIEIAVANIGGEASMVARCGQAYPDLP